MKSVTNKRSPGEMFPSTRLEVIFEKINDVQEQRPSLLTHFLKMD